MCVCVCACACVCMCMCVCVVYLCSYMSPFRFEGVPLVTPNGDVLIRELNFEVSFAAGY